MKKYSVWDCAWLILKFIGRALFDTHRLAQDVGAWWGEWLLTKPPTLLTLVGFIALGIAFVFYCCWMALYLPANRIVTGKWGLNN